MAGNDSETDRGDVLPSHGQHGHQSFGNAAEKALCLRGQAEQSSVFSSRIHSKTCIFESTAVKGRNKNNQKCESLFQYSESSTVCSLCVLMM